MIRQRNPLVLFDNYMPDPDDVSTRKGHEVRMAVLHTTGGGIVERGKRVVFPTGKASTSAFTEPKVSAAISRYVAEFYTKHNNVSTHFVIGWLGEFYQTATEDSRAWSAGIPAAALAAYKDGSWRHCVYRDGQLIRLKDMTPRYESWDRLYREIMGKEPDEAASPDDFFFGSNPDWGGISIDFVAPPWMRKDAVERFRARGPVEDLWQGNPFTIPQYETARELLQELAAHYPSFELDRIQVLPHSFTDPLRRTWHHIEDNEVFSYAWDPGERFKWDMVLGTEAICG